MCIIIVKDHNKKLDDNILVASSMLNPDGLGVLWLDTYEVDKLESNNYSVLRTERPFIAHFRYATVGKVSMQNCHPFSIDEDNVLFQNGTVSNLGDTIKTDTQHLAEILGRSPKSDWRFILEMSDCRFIVADLKKKDFRIYNEEDWIERDGTLFSKRNVLDVNLMAVYGTLKRGGGNHYGYLTNSNYVSNGETLNKYPMIDKGIPYVLSKKGTGHNIVVDVFLVDKTTMEDIDMLEGHPKWYQRKRTPILLASGQVLSCWLYFNDTVEDDGVHIKNYPVAQYEDIPRYSYNNDYWLQDDKVNNHDTFEVSESCSVCCDALWYDEYDSVTYCPTCDTTKKVSEEYKNNW